MAKLVPNTPYYSLLEDILEHLFRPEIQYVYAAADVPNLIELRDVFCIDGKYYVYITIGDKKGFIEIDPADGFDDMKDILVYDSYNERVFTRFYDEESDYPFLNELIKEYNRTMDSLVSKGIFKEKKLEEKAKKTLSFLNKE